MNLVVDELFDDRQVRALIVVDNFSRDALAITVNHQLRADAVDRYGEPDRQARSYAKRIQVDSGRKFIQILAK